MDKAELKKIQEMYALVVEEMDKGAFPIALKMTYKIKSRFETHPYISNVVGGLLIDIGGALQREDVIVEGLDLIKKDVEQIVKILKDPSTAYYNLANGYYKLFVIKSIKEPNYNLFIQSELDEDKINLRKSLEYNSNDPKIFVNLGNCYDHLGRNIDALECYDNALNLNPNEPMALGNRGIALCKYAPLLGKHYRTILFDAHYFISKALEIGVIPESENSFLVWLNWIEKQFSDQNVLENPPKFPGYKIESNSEIDHFFKEFIMENRLYLNVCTFCQKCDASIGDSINIEKMKKEINEDHSDENDPYLKQSSYLNQIKDDFIAARFLLILSRYKDLNLDFVYEHTKFVYTLDYNLHEIHIELLKLSFKNFYDILDKTALFINEYIPLQKNPRKINFRKIWYDPWSGNPNGSIINEEIVKTKSYGFNALFDIHWDLEWGGPYNNLRQTRNALTHRFVKIKLICNEENDEEMLEDTLVEKTLQLAKIVRNAIFYLMYAVNEIEKQKYQKISTTSK